MDSSRKSNKIRDIVRLQQILKKWKKVANNNRSTDTTSITTSVTTTNTTTRSIKFLKKTLSFSESSLSSALANNNNNNVPKGYIAVCVGKELKRFVIPTDYLRHQVFGILLREAEEEFGFQQEGVLKFPCEVDLFEKILKMMEDKKRSLSSPSLLLLLNNDDNDNDDDEDDDSGFFGDNHHHDLIINCSANNYSPADATDHEHLSTPSSHHHPQLCR